MILKWNLWLIPLQYFQHVLYIKYTNFYVSTSYLYWLLQSIIRSQHIFSNFLIQLHKHMLMYIINDELQFTIRASEFLLDNKFGMKRNPQMQRESIMIRCENRKYSIDWRNVIHISDDTINKTKSISVNTPQIDCNSSKFKVIPE